jgi:AraC-like DNA-binding protein
MKRSSGHDYLPRKPTLASLPEQLYFRVEEGAAWRQYVEDTHPWGELVYSYRGITEVRTGGRQFLAPAFMGIWIPPGTTHTGFIHGETDAANGAAHASLYVDQARCGDLPTEVRTVQVAPVLRALLTHLRDEAVGDLPVDPNARQRMLAVVRDLLIQSRTDGSYIPTATDPLVWEILDGLRSDPADSRSVSEIAQAHGISERTLSRRCRLDLGMSLTDWRHRLKVASALELLNSGETVEACALSLGYSTASAFIAMFKSLMGTSPYRYVHG